MNMSVLSLVYGAVALISALLFVGYFLLSKKRNSEFLALFFCVGVSNSGYFLMSVCHAMTVAKIANGLSYFGGAFSILVMLYIIFDVCQIKKKKLITWILTAISITVFAIAASGDWLGLYYRALSLEVVNNSTRLVKDYGPLHSIYTIYLGSYVAIMLACIVYGAGTKKLASIRYTVFLFVTVLLNVGVWLVEQVIQEEFEFLAVSYVATAILLLLIYNMLCDYGIIQPGEGIVSVQMLTQLNTRQINPGALPPAMEAMFHNFAEKVKTLSSAERRIMQYYMDGYDIGDVPDLAYISIHTVKKHNRSIYQKLDIASRDELMLYIELFRCCGRLEELACVETEMTEE